MAADRGIRAVPNRHCGFVFIMIFFFNLLNIDQYTYMIYFAGIAHFAMCMTKTLSDQYSSIMSTCFGSFNADHVVISKCG